MLEGVEMKGLRRTKTGVGREAELTPDHGLTADADKDGATVGQERGHIPHTGVIGFGRTDESESGIEDETFHVAYMRHAGRKSQIATQGPDIGDVMTTHKVIHRFASSGDVIDDKRSEGVECPTGYLRPEGVDG